MKATKEQIRLFNKSYIKWMKDFEKVAIEYLNGLNETIRAHDFQHEQDFTEFGKNGFFWKMGVYHDQEVALDETKRLTDLNSDWED